MAVRVDIRAFTFLGYPEILDAWNVFSQAQVGFLPKDLTQENIDQKLSLTCCFCQNFAVISHDLHTELMQGKTEKLKETHVVYKLVWEVLWTGKMFEFWNYFKAV